MFLPDDYEDVAERVSFFTLEKIDILIRTSSLDRCEMLKRVDKIQNEEDAMRLYNYLRGNQLIPGYHYTPHSVVDQGIAIRFMVDKDNLHELRFKDDTQIP